MKMKLREALVALVAATLCIVSARGSSSSTGSETFPTADEFPSGCDFNPSATICNTGTSRSSSASVVPSYSGSTGGGSSSGGTSYYAGSTGVGSSSGGTSYYAGTTGVGSSSGGTSYSADTGGAATSMTDDGSIGSATSGVAVDDDGTTDDDNIDMTDDGGGSSTTLDEAPFDESSGTETPTDGDRAVDVTDRAALSSSWSPIGGVVAGIVAVLVSLGV